MNIFESKKGQGRNYLTVMVFLFAFGFLSVLGYLFLNSFITEFDNAGYYTDGVKTVGDSYLAVLRLFDNIIVLVMVVMIIGVGVTSYKLAAPPIYFLLTFVTAAVYGFISYFFNFIFAQIVSQPVFVATMLYFPNTLLICTNLHWVMLVTIVVGSVTLYAKKPRGQYLG